MPGYEWDPNAKAFRDRAFFKLGAPIRNSRRYRDPLGVSSRFCEGCLVRSYTWRFMGSYKYGYKPPNMSYNYSYLTYNPTYN